MYSGFTIHSTIGLIFLEWKNCQIKSNKKITIINSPRKKTVTKEQKAINLQKWVKHKTYCSYTYRKNYKFYIDNANKVLYIE